MSPRSLFSAVVALVICFGFSSCQYHLRKFAKANPPAGTVVNWPGKPFASVRGYCYDYTAEQDGSFFVDGRMHKGVMDPKGVLLSPAQVKTLLKCITVSQPVGPRTPCYAPHHAFVFYDAKGAVVACFEMCFGCNSQVSTPAGVPEYVDREGLWQLTGELGLPLGKGNQFYTDVCRRR